MRHTIMDGISGPVAGKLPLEVLLRHGVKALTVDDGEALAAVATSFYGNVDPAVCTRALAENPLKLA